jgi:hypothetical protein
MNPCPEVHPSGATCSREAGHSGNHRPKLRHTCHWPGCETEVAPKLWGCAFHWLKLPKRLRDRVWAAYVPGQEITKTPSAKYLEVALDVQRWIVEFESAK